MPNRTPLVAAALICERVLAEPDPSGRSFTHSLIRVVDKYTITEVAVPLPENRATTAIPAGTPQGGVIALQGPLVNSIDLTVFVALKAGDLVGTSSEASVVLRRPDGRTTSLPSSWPLNFSQGPEEGASLTARFAMPITSPAGLYWFDVVWQGEVLTSIPLRIVRESTPQDSESVPLAKS